jgi:hypothetical protein
MKLVVAPVSSIAFTFMTPLISTGIVKCLVIRYLVIASTSANLCTFRGFVGDEGVGCPSSSQEKIRGLFHEVD